MNIRQEIYIAVVRILKWLAGIYVIIFGLIAGIAFFNGFLDNDTFATYFIWTYLLGVVLILLRSDLIKMLNRKYRNEIIASIKLSIITFIGLGWEIVIKILKLLIYLGLAVISIGVLFLIGGWIASLSATTIIIILLILILLK